MASATKRAVALELRVAGEDERLVELGGAVGPHDLADALDREVLAQVPCGCEVSRETRAPSAIAAMVVGATRRSEPAVVRRR
jgi:hypothetical protein